MPEMIRKFILKIIANLLTIYNECHSWKVWLGKKSEDNKQILQQITSLVRALMGYYIIIKNTYIIYVDICDCLANIRSYEEYTQSMKSIFSTISEK